MNYELVKDFATNLETMKIVSAIAYPMNFIMQDLCICQAILESNLINKPSQLALPPNNNLFGIKGTGTDGSVFMPTQEEYNGKFITIKAAFAKNDNLIDSVMQHKKVLSLSRYKSVWEAKTFEDAANAVRLCGYATDSSYSTSLMSLYNKYLK